MKIQRSIVSEFEEYLKIFPVTGIIGPRQVGKTTLTKQIGIERSFEYLDLEKPEDRQKLSDPVLYFSEFQEKDFIIDEIQLLPNLFPTLRGIIDQNRRPGRFIILGSASPEIINKSSETLAGRIGYLELTPFLLNEVGALDQLWLRGGFPLSFLANNENASHLWRKNFINTYIQLDLGKLGLQTDVQIMERFWYLLASSHGNLLNIHSQQVSQFSGRGIYD
jgi:predicted AAA+ superfamily ATPase